MLLLKRRRKKRRKKVSEHNCYYLRMAVTNPLLQKRKSRTKIWASVCSTKVEDVCKFSYGLLWHGAARSISSEINGNHISQVKRTIRPSAVNIVLALIRFDGK